MTKKQSICEHTHIEWDGDRVDWPGGRSYHGTCFNCDAAMREDYEILPIGLYMVENRNAPVYLRGQA